MKQDLLHQYQNFYFIGIGGIGMSNLARYFHASGKRVLGYDKTSTKLTKQLQSEGIQINFQDSVEQDELDLLPENTLVIYTPAIKELAILDYFKNQNFKVFKRAQVLGMITQDTTCLAVGGTHGKTTTSSLVAHLCDVAGLPFSAFLGGISENFESNFKYTGSRYAVVEADEYDRSFLSLSPDWAVITSTDADHLDIYGDESTIREGFAAFAALVPERQLLVRKGIEVGREVQTYAVNETADYYSDNLRMEGDQIYFDFHARREALHFTDLHWSIPGIHNVENATAAIGLLLNIGATENQIRKGIASFFGIKRRYTKHVFPSGKIYIDDYAHHPTELDAVLGSIKTFYPDKKLLVVFQPHLFSRTRDFAEGFARSLSAADELLLLEIYPARELSTDFPGISSAWLADKIVHPDKEVCTLSSALEKIKQKDFDILLTAGAGDIDTLYDPIVLWLHSQKLA